MADREPVIVLVEDNPENRKLLRIQLSRRFKQVTDFPGAPEALEFLKGHAADLVITDYMMPRMDGFELLRRIRSEVDRSLPVIVTTAFGSIQNAVQFLRLGASDYIPKPIDFGELHLAIDRLLEERHLVLENRALKAALDLERGSHAILGRSAGLSAILAKLATVARSEATVLVTGETGTGKNLVARELHRLSHRSAGPFVAVNCGALPETLLESELFGHEKGAFTGAVAEKPGLVEEAQGGTLFLDEISTLGTTFQAKLLHLLADRTFRRVGATETRRADVRLVSSTNDDLKQLIAGGRFREDLYYRINVIPVELPPLRARKEDIPDLLAHFAALYGARDHKALKGFTREAMRAILEHDWPGNVRELENFVERAVALAAPEEDWSPLVPGEADGGRPATCEPAGSGTFNEEKERAVARFEREYLIQALTAAGGNVTLAAQQAGKNRTEFHALLKRSCLSSRDFKRKPGDGR